MSSTNRGQRGGGGDDFFKTPSWCVRRLLEACPLPGGRWLEPACGDGAIVRAVDAVREDVQWCLGDVRPEAVDAAAFIARQLQAVNPGNFTSAGVFAAWCGSAPFTAIITNPPFSLAEPFVRRALELAPHGYVAMLLRIAWNASEERNAFLRADMPDTYDLPNRPSFAVFVREAFKCVPCKKKYTAPLGQTTLFCAKCANACEHTGQRKTSNDSADYRWCVWTPERGRSVGRNILLPTTSAAERALDVPPPAEAA